MACEPGTADPVEQRVINSEDLEHGNRDGEVAAGLRRAIEVRLGLVKLNNRLQALGTLPFISEVSDTGSKRGRNPVRCFTNRPLPRETTWRRLVHSY